MKKVFSALTLLTLSLSSISSVFAGEYDTTNKIEQSGGFIQISDITLQVPSDAVSTTSNLISKEVSGMNPAVKPELYNADGKYIKLSLQDIQGKEIQFSTGVTIVFNNIKDSYKNPVILFNDGKTIQELSGAYIPEVKSISINSILNINGVFTVADKLGENNKNLTITDNNSNNINFENNSSFNSGTVSINGINNNTTSNNIGILNDLNNTGVLNNGNGINNKVDIQERKGGASVLLIILVFGMLISVVSVLIYRKV